MYGPLKAAGIPLTTLFTPPATGFYRLHAPTVFGDDASQRRKTVVLAAEKQVSISGVEPGRELLSVFGSVPITSGDKHLGTLDVGIPFGKPFAERIKQRFGVDIAIHGFDGKDFATLASTLAETTAATPDELTRVFAGGLVQRDATVGRHAAAVYLGQIKNYAGAPVAVLEPRRARHDGRSARHLPAKHSRVPPDAGGAGGGEGTGRGRQESSAACHGRALRARREERRRRGLPFGLHGSRFGSM